MNHRVNHLIWYNPNDKNHSMVFGVSKNHIFHVDLTDNENPTIYNNDSNCLAENDQFIL